LSIARATNYVALGDSYAAGPIGFLDVPYLRSTQKRLNSMLATQAAAAGATLVNWYGASIGHDANALLATEG